MMQVNKFVLSPCFDDVSISRYAFKKVLESETRAYLHACVIKLIYFDDLCSRLQD